MVDYTIALSSRKDYTSGLMDVRLGHVASSGQWNVSKSGLCHFQAEALRARMCFPTISDFSLCLKSDHVP